MQIITSFAGYKCCACIDTLRQMYGDTAVQWFWTPPAPRFLFSKASLPGMGGISVARRDVLSLAVWISPTFLVLLRLRMDSGEFTLGETETSLNVNHSGVETRTPLCPVH